MRKWPEPLPRCSCGHSWEYHDQYGCYVMTCGCPRIDQDTWYDRAANRKWKGRPKK